MAYDAEDCGFQMLSDDEVVTSGQEESDTVDNETDEDEDNNNNNESSKGPTTAEAFSVLETAMDSNTRGIEDESYYCELWLNDNEDIRAITTLSKLPHDEFEPQQIQCTSLR
ncbi:hypothetical protein TNCV_2265351 [Trichonephila clavipes]|nr:hypothetical protein TNCV_2265351 [Trichonephila clavipes]